MRERLRNAEQHRNSLYGKILFKIRDSKNLLIILSFSIVIISIAIYNNYYSDDKPVKMPDFGM